MKIVVSLEDMDMEDLLDYQHDIDTGRLKVSEEDRIMLKEEIARRRGEDEESD